MSAVPEQLFGRVLDCSEWHDLAAVLYNGAAQYHGDLEITLQRFCDKLLHTADKSLPPAASWQQRVEFLTRQHTRDLYLAVACGQGSEAGWQRFASLYQKYLHDVLHHLAAIRQVGVEVVDNIIIDLCLPDRSGERRIASYDGRSSLATWLRVILSNRIINEGQRKCNAACPLDSSNDVVDTSALPKLDTDLKLNRYEELIRDCLRAACVPLSEKEKLMLLWRFDEELQLGEIAKFLGVHQSTITRSLERTTRCLYKRFVANLSATHNLGQAAIDECISVLMDSSTLSISILALLREGDPLPRPNAALESKPRRRPPGVGRNDRTM